jgi:hypothetical protein
MRVVRSWPDGFLPGGASGQYKRSWSLKHWNAVLAADRSSCFQCAYRTADLGAPDLATGAGRAGPVEIRTDGKGIGFPLAVPTLRRFEIADSPHDWGRLSVYVQQRNHADIRAMPQDRPRGARRDHAVQYAYPVVFRGITGHLRLWPSAHSLVSLEVFVRCVNLWVIYRDLLATSVRFEFALGQCMLTEPIFRFACCVTCLVAVSSVLDFCLCDGGNDMRPVPKLANLGVRTDTLTPTQVDYAMTLAQDSAVELVAAPSGSPRLLVASIELSMRSRDIRKDSLAADPTDSPPIV